MIGLDLMLVGVWLEVVSRCVDVWTRDSYLEETFRIKSGKGSLDADKYSLPADGCADNVYEHNDKEAGLLCLLLWLVWCLL